MKDESTILESTIQINGGPVVPFDKFTEAVDRLAKDNGHQFDRETGELIPYVQPTLDDAMFRPLKVETVRVNFSGAAELSLKDLKAYANGTPLTPGRDVEVTLQGYIAGAGVKWKRGGDGPAGSLNIVLTDLLTMIVQETAYIVKEAAEGAAVEGGE